MRPGFIACLLTALLIGPLFSLPARAREPRAGKGQEQSFPTVPAPAVGGDLILVLDLPASRNQGARETVGVPTEVAWSPDGTLIAVGGHSKVVRVFDAVTGAFVGWGPSPHLPIYWHLALAWTPDSQRLISGGGDHVVWVFTRASDFHRLDRGLRPIETWTLDVDVDPTGTLVVAGGKCGRVMIFSLTEPTRGPGAWSRVGDRAGGPPLRAMREPKTADNHSCGVKAVSWSPDGRLIAVGSGWGLKILDAQGTTGNTVPPQGVPGKAWRERPPQEIPVLHHIQKMGGDNSFSVQALDFSPDGRWLASGEGGVRGGVGRQDSHPVRIWDTATWTDRTIDTFSPRPYAVEFSPDGTMLAAGGGREVRVYSTENWQRLQTFTGFNDEVCDVSWSPDSTRIAACAGGEKVDKHAEEGIGPDPFVRVFRVSRTASAPLPPPVAPPDYVREPAATPISVSSEYPPQPPPPVEPEEPEVPVAPVEPVGPLPVVATPDPVEPVEPELPVPPPVVLPEPSPEPAPSPGPELPPPAGEAATLLQYARDLAGNSMAGAARAVYQDLLDRFPESEEAAEARQDLERLDEQPSGW